MESLDAFIDRPPKVELHLHLVGSASVPTVLELRRRHPDWAGVPSSAAELAAFYGFRNFPHFSEVYGAVSSLVREPADVAELVLGAARDLAGQQVRYANDLGVTGRPAGRADRARHQLPGRPRPWWRGCGRATPERRRRGRTA